MQTVGLGANSAATLGQQSLQSTAQQNYYNTSAAAATAGGQVGVANALTGALGSLSGGLSSTGLLLGLNNAGMFGGQNQTPQPGIL